MDSLRGFVDAVWTTDPSVLDPNKPREVWSKPDDISRDYELRRLTTTANREGKRTDFFEFYWANLMSDTKMGQLAAWVGVLFLRLPGGLPAQLRGIWWILATTGVAVLGIWTWFLFFPVALEASLKIKISSLLGVLWGASSYFLLRYAGDAARYLHVAPDNIESRRRIRDAGVKVLQSLHESRKYDRIIVVGHSLGTVIGYDILTHLWPHYNDRHPLTEEIGPSPALEALEALARAETPPQLAEYQAAQSAYAAELRQRGCDWLVTDFITMGSPLAHASALLARSEREFRAKIAGREFPSCPPTLENLGKKWQFSFKDPLGVRIPHHAAVFAPVRWTNIYFPCRWTFWGDVIGGPVAPHFGPGIEDIPVKSPGRFGIFSHTKYWDLEPTSAVVPPHLQALRGAIRLSPVSLKTPPAP